MLPRSDEQEDSFFRRIIASRTTRASLTRSASLSMEPHDREANPLGSVRNTSLPLTRSGPLHTTTGTGDLLQHPIDLRGNEAVQNRQESFSATSATGENHNNNSDDRSHNEHLLRSGQLGMCNDPYCTTCPTSVRDSTQERNPTTSTRFDTQFRNVLHTDPEGFARRVYSFCCKCVPGVMNPHTKYVQHWNKILAIFCMAAIFVDPLFFFILYVHKDDKCISIDWNMTPAFVFFRSLIDFAYFLNILLQFKLAYVSPESRVVGAGELVDHPTRIALNYFCGYFLFDFFVVIPLPQIILFLVLPHHLGTSIANNHAKIVLWAAFLLQYIPRLFRFLPLLIGQSPTKGLIFESAWANFIINLLIVMLSGHAIGSLWYLFCLKMVDICLQEACHSSGFTGCWNYIDCDCGRRLSSHLYKWKHNENVNACLNASSGAFDYGMFAKAVPLTLKTNSVNKYLYSMFWGFQQISTLGGNLNPSYYAWEVIFTICIIGLGLSLFALLVGNIQNFLQALGRRSLEMQLKGHDVEQWMSHRHLPEDLKTRIREAERYHWAATRGVNEEMLLESMPEDVERDIRRHLFKFIKKVRILALMDEAVIDAISERLRQKIYIKGSNVLYQGGVVEKMVFVVRGKLESTGEDGATVSLSEGDACGEELLRWYLENSSVSGDGRKVRLPGERLLCDRTVKCLTNVEAFSLRAADLKEVTILFTRFLKNPRAQGALRYESPYWRSLAAFRIQVIWRYWKRRLNRAASRSD